MSTTEPIYIISQFTLEEWDERSPWDPGVGGSETSHVEMATRLASRGHEVVSVAPVKADYHTRTQRFASGGSLEWLDSRQFSFPDRPATIFNYRCPVLFNRPKPAEQRWIYVSQDVDAGGWTPESLARVDRYLALCEKHAQWTQGRYPQLRGGKTFISSNGVRSDYLDINFPIERVIGRKVPYRMLYASSPDRGLMVLLQNWFRIKERVPEATLHVAYGFDNMIKVIESGANPALVGLKGDLERLMTQPGIEWLGRIGQHELYNEWAEASVFPYPSSWPETNCISIQDAMALGAVPVTTNFWAQGEFALRAPLSYVIDGLPERSELVRSYWLDLLEDALVATAEGEFNQPYSMGNDLASLMSWARREFDWDVVVSQWEGWLA